MTLHTAIAVGYCNIATAMLEKCLWREYKDGGFVVKISELRHEEPVPYASGQIEARKLAAALLERYQATLCVGIVCVRFPPPHPSLRGPKLDIGAVIEDGVLKDEVPLNPHSCERETRFPKGVTPPPGEHIYCREAVLNLIEYLKVRRRSRLLRHIS